LILGTFAALGSLLMFLLFYAGVRLEFVLFDLVLTRARMVAPIWRKYGFCTWRWVGIKLLLSTIFIVVCGIPLLSVFRYATTHMPAAGQQPTPEFVSGIIAAYGVMALAFLVLSLCASLLNDFVLPSIALENTSLSEGLMCFFELFRKEPGQLVSYIFFKVILYIAALVATEIAILVAELIAAIPLGIVAFLGWLLLHSHGSVGQILMVTGGVVLFLIFFVFLFYLTILVAGCTVVFFQAYVMYFLGGRYPMLGDRLEPPEPVYAAVAFPSDLPPAPASL